VLLSKFVPAFHSKSSLRCGLSIPIGFRWAGISEVLKDIIPKPIRFSKPDRFDKPALNTCSFKKFCFRLNFLLL